MSSWVRPAATSELGSVALVGRPLIDPVTATKLAGIFKVLANGSRLRLLHALARTDELCVGDLSDAIAMRPTAVSNQLRRLADRKILSSRRDGNRICYRIADPRVISLLDQALCVSEDPIGLASRGAT